MYIAEPFDSYIKKRLAEVPLHRRAPRKQFHEKMGYVDPSLVIIKGNQQFSVQSGTDPSIRYDNI